MEVLEKELFLQSFRQFFIQMLSIYIIIELPVF